MRVQPRKAAQAISGNPILRQVLESALGAGIVATPEILSGDADMDLALAILGGLAVAAPGAYVGQRAGALAGRQIDKYFHADPRRIDAIPHPVRWAHSTGMGAVSGSRQHVRALQNLGIEGPALDAQQALATGYARRADNSMMDPYLNGAEHDLKVIGAKFGDNIAQAAAQLGINAVLNMDDEEQDSL